jgi:hypothetical protein
MEVTKEYLDYNKEYNEMFRNENWRINEEKEIEQKEKDLKILKTL